METAHNSFVTDAFAVLSLLDLLSRLGALALLIMRLLGNLAELLNDLVARELVLADRRACLRSWVGTLTLLGAMRLPPRW